MRAVIVVASRAASSALLGAIGFYRVAISAWLPARCRFAPSCSAYASEAITLHGPLHGSRLAIARIARCHPWHAGGHDPVPPAGSEGAQAPRRTSSHRGVRRSP